MSVSHFSVCNRGHGNRKSDLRGGSTYEKEGKRIEKSMNEKVRIKNTHKLYIFHNFFHILQFISFFVQTSDGKTFF